MVTHNIFRSTDKAGRILIPVKSQCSVTAEYRLCDQVVCKNSGVRQRTFILNYQLQMLNVAIKCKNNLKLFRLVVSLHSFKGNMLIQVIYFSSRRVLSL